MDEKNIVSIEDRIPKLKEARKKKTNRRLIFYLSLFFLLIMIIVYLQSPLSHVKKVVVTGNSLVTNEEVKRTSHITSKSNIWAVKEKKVEKLLKKNPIIKTVKLEKHYPRTIKLKVTEHKLAGYVSEKGGYYPVLGNGEQLMEQKQTRLNGRAPILKDFSKKALKEMSSELIKLPKSTMNMISEVHWKPTDDNKHKIVLYMNDGYLVDATTREFAENMNVYPSIVNQLDDDDKGIIHIGAGAYFEPFEKAKKHDE